MCRIDYGRKPTELEGALITRQYSFIFDSTRYRIFCTFLWSYVINAVDESSTLISLTYACQMIGITSLVLPMMV